jgi:hypothetical protein
MRSYKFERKAGIRCLCNPFTEPRIVNSLVISRVYEHKSMKHGNIYIGNYRRRGVHKIGTWNDLREGTLCAFNDDEVTPYIYK